MSRAFFLARRYIAFHKAKTGILVGCIALTVYLPVVMHLLVDRFSEQLGERARATPLIVGAKGSRFDLALHAMYFRARSPEQVLYHELNRIGETGLAQAVPIHAKFRAREFPVVGTSLDYFSMRGLQVASGDPLIRLGDCVVGAAVADSLDLTPGDRLLTDPENPFDLAGSYPLNMRVVGVLGATGTADDGAVFVDLKTAWIIEGIGHGHQDLAEANDENVILDRTDRNVVASAALEQYTEITDANIDTFHFHGDPSDFPLTAILVLPHDARSGTFLMGRYLAPGLHAQILQPTEIIDELMAMVFRVRQFFHMAALVLGIVTCLFFLLVVMLSLRLRQRELETMFKIGCSRFMILRLLAAELAIVTCAGVLVAALLAAATSSADSLLLDLIL